MQKGFKRVPRAEPLALLAEVSGQQTGEGFRESEINRAVVTALIPKLKKLGHTVHDSTVDTAATNNTFHNKIHFSLDSLARMCYNTIVLISYQEQLGCYDKVATYRSEPQSSDDRVPRSSSLYVIMAIISPCLLPNSSWYEITLYGTAEFDHLL